MVPIVLVALDWLLTAILFVTIVILVKIVTTVQKKKKMLGDMPSYHGGLPLIGHAHLATQFTYSGIVDEIVKTRKENNGTLYLWIGPKLCAYITNPGDIENIFTRKDALDKGYLLNFFQAHSSGMITSIPPRFNRLRKMATVPLGHKQMIDSFLYIYQEQSRILMQTLIEQEGRYFDIYPYLSRCCQDITYEAHFGVKFEIQHNKELSVHETVTESLGYILERMTKVWVYPDLIYYRTENGKALKKCVEHNRNIAIKIIEERKRILEEGKIFQEEKAPHKRMSKLLDVYLDKESGMTQEEIIHEVLDIMLAGFESMSQTQAWVLLLLAMFPQHQEKVQRELDEVFGEVNNITLEDLQKCQYLDMVTKESLRLFGLPVVIRRLANDVVIENYTMPAETEVIVGMCVVHRDPRYWTHPDSFYPDHFLPEEVAARPKYAYVPFGGGPRKCPAYAYGMVTVKFILAILLRKYRFTTKQDFHKLPLDLYFMYKPTDGFLLKYNPR